MGLTDARDTATNDAALLRRSLIDRGEALTVVKGSSMLPLLRDGDIVRLEPCGVPRVGDVVAVAGPRAFVAHRVIRVGATMIVCRGDNRGAPDAPVPHEALLGRVAAVAWTGGRRNGWPVLQGRVGAAWGSACHRVQRARVVGRHVAGELRLLRAQVRRAAPAAPGAEVVPWMERVLGVPQEDLRYREARVLRRLANGGWEASPLLDTLLADADFADESQPQAAYLVVPARLVCALAAPLRGEVLEGARAFTPPDGTMVVAAFARARQHRVARVGACLRALLAAAGRPAGASGDAALMLGVAALPVHLFARDEFVGELRRLGLEPVALTASRDRLGLPLWRAEVRAPRAGLQETRRARGDVRTGPSFT